MKKYYLASILILCCCYSFAQSKDKTGTSEAIPNAAGNAKPASETVNPLPETSVAVPVFEKKPLPIEKKAAPATFYVTNDQPCDRRTYMSHLKQNAPKN